MATSTCAKFLYFDETTFHSRFQKHPDRAQLLITALIEAGMCSANTSFQKSVALTPERLIGRSGQLPKLEQFAVLQNNDKLVLPNAAPSPLMWGDHETDLQIHAYVSSANIMYIQEHSSIRRFTTTGASMASTAAWPWKWITWETVRDQHIIPMLLDYWRQAERNYDGLPQILTMHAMLSQCGNEIKAHFIEMRTGGIFKQSVHEEKQRMCKEIIRLEVFNCPDETEYIQCGS